MCVLSLVMAYVFRLVMVCVLGVVMVCVAVVPLGDFLLKGGPDSLVLGEHLDS